MVLEVKNLFKDKTIIINKTGRDIYLRISADKDGSYMGDALLRLETAKEVVEFITQKINEIEAERCL